jgi:DNA-binding protein HU-beta
MNKRELIESVADSTDLSRADAERAVEATFTAIGDTVAKGDKVVVPGFGSFVQRERAARTGRNPQTGEEMEIAATSVPAFKPGSAFKDQVAGEK